MKPRKQGAIARLYLVKAIRRYSRMAGRLDEQEQLGSMGTAVIRAVRKNALDAGCFRCDVDDATMEGLDYGRADVPEMAVAA